MLIERDQRLITAPSAMPVRTAWRMHSRLGVGSMPGLAASIRLTWLLGSAPNSVEAPEKSLGVRGHLGMDLEADHDLQSPVSPWMR